MSRNPKSDIENTGSLDEGTLGIQSTGKAAGRMARRIMKASVPLGPDMAKFGAVGAVTGAIAGPTGAALGAALGAGLTGIAGATEYLSLKRNIKNRPNVRTTEAQMGRREKVKKLGDEAHQADKRSAKWKRAAAWVRKKVGGNTAVGRSAQAFALGKSNKWYKKGQKARALKDKIDLADKYTPGTYFEEFVESVKQLAEAKGISNREALKEMVLSQKIR